MNGGGETGLGRSKHNYVCVHSNPYQDIIYTPCPKCVLHNWRGSTGTAVVFYTVPGAVGS